MQIALNFILKDGFIPSFLLKNKNMKKIIIALICVSAAFNLNAQSDKTKEALEKYRIGIFAGLGFNSLKPIASTSDNYAITKVKGHTGFLFGVSADWTLNERYTAFSGIGLDWRGGSIKATAIDSTVIPANYLKSASTVYKMQYLTVPFGLKMKATEFDKVKIYAQTGVDLAILLSQKGDYTGVLANNVAATPITNSKLGGYSNVNPINFGWSIGIGGEYDLDNNNACYFTFLYRNGIIDATLPKTNKDLYKFSDGNIRSNTFSLRVGYYF
jgi:hypothetical protein